MRITIGIVALIAALATACAPSEPTAAVPAPDGETPSGADLTAADADSVVDVRTEHARTSTGPGIAERVASCGPDCAAPGIEVTAPVGPRVVFSSASGTIAVLDIDGLVHFRAEQRSSAYVLNQKPPLNVTVVAALPMSPVGERIHRPGPPGEVTPGADR